MKSIVIQGQKFEVNTPYVAGHVLTEIEAKVLNQTRLENIRNNCAKAVGTAVEAGKPFEEIAAAVAAYDAEYTFAMGGGGGRSADPVETEARAIARAVVRSKILESGRKVKDVAKEKFDAAVEKVMERDEVLKLAKQRVAQRKKVVDVDIDVDLAA